MDTNLRETIDRLSYLHYRFSQTNAAYGELKRVVDNLPDEAMPNLYRRVDQLQETLADIHKEMRECLDHLNKIFNGQEHKQ